MRGFALAQLRWPRHRRRRAAPAIRAPGRATARACSKRFVLHIAARLRDGGLRDARQTVAGFAAVRIQRLRRFETLAAPVPSAALNLPCRKACSASSSRRCTRMSGQIRLASGCLKTTTASASSTIAAARPAPQTAVPPSRRRRSCGGTTELDFLQPVGHRFDPAARRVVGVAGHRRSDTESA